MKRNTAWSILAAVAFATPQVVASDDEERLKSIVSAVSQRHETYNPVRVEYRVNQTRFKYWFVQTSTHLDPDHKQTMAKLRDIQQETRYVFARKGNLLSIESEGQSFSDDGDLLDPKMVCATVYDGKLQISTSGDRTKFAITREAPFFSGWIPKSWPIEFNGERDLLFFQRSFAEGKKTGARRVAVIDDAATVKGAAIRLVLDFDKSVYEMWLTSEEEGCCLKKLQRKNKQGQLLYEYTDCEYAVVDGIRYPRAAVQKRYYHMNDHHGLSEIKKYEADKITFRGEEIPDEEFRLAIPSGAEVLDQDTHQRIKDPIEVEKHISEAVASVERRGQSGWWRWMYLAASILFLAACGYIVGRMVWVRWGRKVR